MSTDRRKFSREFKLQILGEIAAGKSVAQATRDYDITDGMISQWRRQYAANPNGAFCGNGSTARLETRIAELERMVGRLAMENDLLKKALARRAATDK